MREYPEDIVHIAATIADNWCMPECEDPLTQAIAAAIMAERERCARTARIKFTQEEHGSNYVMAGSMIAADILGVKP